MRLSVDYRCVAIFSLILVSDVPLVLAAKQQPVDWLRGSGQDLQLCLRGEVLNPDGRPATNTEVVCGLNAMIRSQPLKASIDGQRFELWIPVNRPRPYSLWLKASSADSDYVAYRTFNAYQLRQAAIDGLKLALQPPTRQVKITVTDQGRPVPGAQVKAQLGFGIELRSTTDVDGIARLALLPQQKLTDLTAWTDDHRIGGFTFHRSPPRDPEADEHVIELSKCRDQRMRFVADDGSPVSGIKFVLHIATPPPHYNYIGSTDDRYLTTDAAGEATYPWFPDWEKVHWYADIDETDWLLEGGPATVDGVAIFTLKKRSPRKRIAGRVVTAGTTASPGGFYAYLQSFQGEREGHSDWDSAFSDPDGTFSVDVLPDATYCAYVQDERWVGKVIDILPYESAVNRLTSPELAIAAGQPVEVFVTSGSQHKPLANLSVSFRREHEYTWQEDGDTRHGISGPQWWATTNESGKVSTWTLPGKLHASIYSPRWRAEQSIDVAADKPARVTLHRDIDEKRTFTGRIVLDETADKSFDDVDIRLGSLDANYQDEQSLQCSADGSFSFDTFAAEVGIFASTRDGKLAGSTSTKDIESPIEIHLRRTGEYHGQLLGRGEQPAVCHPVSAYIRLEGERTGGSQRSKTFEVKRIDTKTDELGNFTLQGIPSRMKTKLFADAIDSSDDSVSLDEIYLEPGESRPRVVSYLERTATTPVKIPLAERYRTTLRDCVLSGYRPIVIIADDSEGVRRFVDDNYASYATNKDVYPFMQIILTGGKVPVEPADAAFLAERDWPLPQAGRVFACALDANGTELGRQEFHIDDAGAAEEAANFIHQHAPAPQDAEKKWAAAFAEARRTNRRVWARVSQRYCGPCFRMTRWLDDQRAPLEKDYVMLKIDNVRDTNGEPVAERLIRGQRVGIPFHGIFDASGNLLIDSNGPLGNIGHPSGIDGKKHLRKMLLETRQHLTDEEVDHLVESTGN
jgi:hypothetical protein